MGESGRLIEDQKVIFVFSTLGALVVPRVNLKKDREAG